MGRAGAKSNDPGFSLHRQRASFLAMSIFRLQFGRVRFARALAAPGSEFALVGRAGPGPSSGLIFATIASNVPPPNCGCAAFTVGKSLDMVYPSTYTLRR